MSESPATNILRAARNLMLRVAPPPSTWASFRNIIFASCLRTSTFRFSTNADRLLASRVERTPDLHSHLSAYPDFLLFGALPIPSIHHQWALNFAVKDNAALTFLCELAHCHMPPIYSKPKPRQSHYLQSYPWPRCAANACQTRTIDITTHHSCWVLPRTSSR